MDPATGAATGAAAGTVVSPGIGTAVGAIGGALLGGAASFLDSSQLIGLIIRLLRNRWSFKNVCLILHINVK